MLLIIAVFVMVSCAIDEIKIPKKTVFLLLIPFGLLFAGLAVFLPSSNTFAAMVVIPRITESEAIQKDLPELYKAAVEKLKEELAQ